MRFALVRQLTAVVPAPGRGALRRSHDGRRPFFGSFEIAAGDAYVTLDSQPSRTPGRVRDKTRDDPVDPPSTRTANLHHHHLVPLAEDSVSHH